MGIKTIVHGGQIIERGGQAFDGFHIVVTDDEEFKGTYAFTEDCSVEEAHELIFAGEVEPE